MKVEVQMNYQNILARIGEYIDYGQSNFYQNSIIYEYEVINMCINTCPTNSAQISEIGVSAFSGVCQSLSKMSPSGDLVTALQGAAKYVYQKNEQKKQKKIFSVIFYLEQLKWQIIKNVLNGKGINVIRKALDDNYNQLIKRSNQWIIKCTWIKIISDLLQYIPIITKSGYQELVTQYNLNNDWNQLIQSKQITIIDKDQNIGIINNINNGDMVGTIFKSQLVLLDQLQSICLQGNQEIPKFDNFVNNSSEMIEDDKHQKLLKILEYIDSLQMSKLSNIYQQFVENLQKYIETLYILEQQDNLDITQQQSKVELLIITIQKLEYLLSNLNINSKIINKQLNSFIGGTEQYNDQLITFHYYQLYRNYFNIIQMIGIHDDYYIEDQQDQIQFIEIFQKEFQSKLTNEKNEFHNMIKQIIKKNKKIDLIQIIKIVDDQINKIQQSTGQKTSKQYIFSILLNQFVSVSFKQIKEYLIKQEQELQSIQQTITKTNQITNLINKNSIQKCLVYFSIINHMKFMYQEIDQIVKDMKISEEEITKFKILSITDILTIYNDQLQQEEQILMIQTTQTISEKLKTCTNHQEIQLFLWTLKQLEQNKMKRIQKFNQFAEIFKSRCRALLKHISSKDSQYLQILKENGDILLNNIKQGNSIEELYTFLDKRKKLLQNIQQEQKNNEDLIKQIQNEIIFTSILDQQQPYDFLGTNIEQFFNNINQSNNKIIAYLQENLKESNQQELNQQENFNKIIKLILDKLDKITFDINKPIQQEGDYLKQQQSLNSLIFKIQHLTFVENQITKENLEDIKKDLEPIIEFYGKQEKIDTKIICDLIKDIHQYINELPQVYQTQLTDFLIQDKDIEQGNQENQQKDIYQIWKQKLIGIFESDAWRYKEYFYFCCLYTFSLTKNQQVKQSLGRIILFGKYKETDYRIRATLKNKEYQQSLEQLVNSEWNNTKEKVQESLQTTLNQLQSIQLQLQGEERKAQRENLVQQHKDLEQQLEQQIKNVNEIGDILGITINFMKDIKKELISIQAKLDNMINSINQIGQDIKFLRGKTPQQLLEIRMEQVLYNKYIQDSSSVYVQIQVKEFNFENMEEEKNTPLFNYDQHDNGEIDEYLDNSIQTSLLIHGIAGSGKSISARKIEEYLWLKYKKQANNQIWTQQINLDIPIFIQLPILKEPQFNSIEETLLSSIYNFDQKQVNQLQDFVQNSQIRLVFILDSYDELSTQYIGKNLIQSNKIYQWKNKNDLRNPKVITTTRTEIFTNTLYRKWFCENDMAGFKNFKEIRLLPFNQDQRKEFLIQFSQLQLKLQIKDLLEIISKKKTQNIIIEDTLQIYDQLEIGTSQKQEYLLNQNQIKRLLQIIKAHPNVININSDQEIAFNKQLKNIWSVEKFQQSIKQTDIEEILDTPFMLNIVVQVLPQMNEILSSQNYIEDFFKASFVIEKSNQIKSIINRYESNNSFVQQVQQYNQEDINQLKKFIDKQNRELLIQECTIIWDSLIESNFFKHFNIIMESEDINKLLDKLNLQGKIKLKERDIDNQFIIYKALTSKKSTIYEFYQIFFNNYTEKQRMKLIYSNDIKDQISFQIDIERYAVQFAVTMTVLNKTTIEVKPKGILFRGKQEENPFEKFFEDLDQNANYKNLIRKCLPLRQKANFYSFNHKTIQEYLFAKDVLDFLSQVENSIDELIALRNLDAEQLQDSISKLRINLQQYEDFSLNHVNLGDSSFFGTFKFIRIAIKQNERFQEVCYKLSLLSSIFKQMLRLSSNSFYILISAQTTLKNKDFSKIFIADIQIDSTIFKNCNFTDSKFQEVQRNGVNFSNSDLSRANWTGRYTNDLKKFQQSIKQTDIEEISENPFMLSIIVQVQPQMNEILSSQNYIEDFFKASFVIEKSNQIKSIINRYESNNSFVQQVQQYNQEDINQLKKFIDKQNRELLIQECTIIWDSLIESNFFKHFNIIMESEDINKLLDKLNLQGKIKLKERDIDNQFIIYKALTSKKSTIYEFYQIFFNNYTEKQRMKLIYSNDIKDQISFQIDIENYAVQLAVTMTVYNKPTLEVKPKGNLFKEKYEEIPFEKFFDDLDQNANYKNLIRKCLPLRQKANFYSFNHKTIQEYLFAKDVLDFLSKIENDIDQLIALRNQDASKLKDSISKLKINLKQYEDFSLNHVNLGDSSFFGTFKLSEWLSNKMKDFKSIFKQMLRLSSNSFYILISAQTTLKNKDFSKILIADIQIDSTIFKNCNFSDSIFERVQINGVNFSKSDLSRANWTGIQTNDLPIRMHEKNNQIKSISYSYDDQFIIVGDVQGYIYVWDISSDIYTNKIRCYLKIIFINQVKGNILISLIKNQTNQYLIKVWDKDDKEVRQPQLIEYQGNQQDAQNSFTHNNDYIGMIYQQNDVRVITISDCKMYKEHGFQQKLVKIQIHQTQNIIYLITHKYMAIIIWDFSNDKKQEIQTNLLQANLEKVSNWESIFSYDCKFLIIKFASQEKKIQIFNLINKQPKELEFQHNFNKFSLSRNNEFLGLINENELFVYDIFTKSLLFYIKLTKAKICLIQFNKESTQMITVQENFVQKNFVCKLWDVKLLIKKQNLNDKLDQINEAQFSPDGQKIYYSKEKEKSEQLYVAETKTGELQDQINISFIQFKVCLSGRYVYFVDNELNLIQYDLNQKKQVQLLKFPTEYRITQINQSHDHRVFSIMYQQDLQNKSKILIFDYDATKIIREEDIKAHQIIFSYDGRFLYYVESHKIKSLVINYEQIQQEFQNNLEQTEWANETEIKDFLITQDDQYIIFCDNSDNKENLKLFDIKKRQKSDVCNLPVTQIKSFDQYLMVWALDTVFVYNFDFQLIGRQYLDKKLTVCINNKQLLSIDDDNFLKIWKIDKKILQDNEKIDKSIAKLKIIIPKNRISKQILSNVKLDGSKIQSHFNFDLKKYWQHKDD